MFPLTYQQLVEAMAQTGINDVTRASIRSICSLADILADLAGEPCVRLELGNPGLDAQHVGVEAERAALAEGVANIYPAIGGIPQIKTAVSHFLKAFLDVDIPAECAVPTVGSMQGTYSVLSLISKCGEGKDTILFINPGFPVQQLQARMLGLNIRSFDIFPHRGEKLREELERQLADGRVAAMLYCSPNNPAWINLTDEELSIIGAAADSHDCIVLEDLAYLGMDFRTDVSHPGVAPFVPTIARHTQRYILFISSSKIFSYAGQRIAAVCFSPYIFNRHNAALLDFFGLDTMGRAYIFGVLYALSSGVSHSAQRAFAAMLEAAANGELNFVEVNREYGNRAARVKKAFTDNGFRIVYDRDADGQPIGDGFFFTVGYGDMSSKDLQEALLRHGISSISLSGTGSAQQGVRVCVSMMKNEEDFERLEKRLKNFANEF